jgi:hypothetical protein
MSLTGGCVTRGPGTSLCQGTATDAAPPNARLTTHEQHLTNEQQTPSHQPVLAERGCGR